MALQLIWFLLLITDSNQGIATNRQLNSKHPIILVPGDLGSRAYVKDKRSHTKKQIWLSVLDYIYTKRLNEQFSLNFDPKTNKTTDKDNYEVTFPGWGDTWSIEYLDEDGKTFGAYYNTLASVLRQDPYFVSNVTLRGAPYDFRKGPNENGEFEENFKTLVEETYEMNNQSQVVVVAHSYGTLYALKFLQNQDVDWKQNYIKTYVSVSGPYGGVVKAVRGELFGDNSNIFFLSPLKFRNFTRSMVSTAFFLPDPRIWTNQEPLVLTPEANYTAHDYKQLFHDIKFDVGYRMMDAAKRSFDPLVVPTGLNDVYCVYGSGYDTYEQLIYSPAGSSQKAFPEQNPEYKYGAGDGTVNMRSLELCKKWPGVKQITMKGSNHVGLLKDSRLLNLIVKLSGAQVTDDSF